MGNSLVHAPNSVIVIAELVFVSVDKKQFVLDVYHIITVLLFCLLLNYRLYLTQGPVPNKVMQFKIKIDREV